MKVCFCRVLLPVAITIIAVMWWPAGWARVAIVIAAALLAVAGLFPAACCCKKNGQPVEVEKPSP